MINTRVPSSLLVSRIASDIVSKQNSLANVQEQIASGKKVNRPSDAPAESAHLVAMKETISRLQQYNENASIAESQLSLEEGALAGTTNALTRIRDLGLRANSGIVNDGFRADINAEVKLKLEELLTLANSRDSFGNYLFSGSNIEQQPFSTGNPVSYSGSDDGAKLEIALGRTIDTGDTGTDTFMRIRAGNGNFQVSGDPGNTGTGIIDQGSVSNSTLFTGENYEISFTTPTSYDVINLDTGAAVQTGQTFQNDSDISIDGMTTRISGAPAAGDVFRLEPSKYQDMFSSVSKLVAALDASPQNPSENARMRADIDSALGDIDNALDHVNAMRARVGIRLSSIDSSREENESIKLQIERTRRDIEDVDIADAVTRLQTQANSLEILQKSFTRVEGLSLFNYM